MDLMDLTDVPRVENILLACTIGNSALKSPSAPNTKLFDCIHAKRHLGY